jgi:hypothetical protein
MAKKLEMVIALEFRNNGISATPDLINALSELWEINSTLARRIEHGITEIKVNP